MATELFRDIGITTDDFVKATKKGIDLDIVENTKVKILIEYKILH